jgi:hypothetical protein
MDGEEVSMTHEQKRIENALVDGWEAMTERFPNLGFRSCREAQDAGATAIVAFLRGLEKSGDWMVTPSILADQVEIAARPGAADGQEGVGG